MEPATALQDVAGREASDAAPVLVECAYTVVTVRGRRVRRRGHDFGR